MSVKIQTQHRAFYGQRVILPNTGEVELDVEGCVTVSEELASILTSSDSWVVVSKEEGDDDSRLGEKDASIEYKRTLMKSKLEELREVALEQYSEDQESWKDLSKKDLIDYLMKRFEDSEIPNAD